MTGGMAMKFKDRLRELRTSRGLTQDDFAKATGLTRSAISMYESGKREPNFEVLEMIADFFNVDMNYLLGKNENSTYYLNPETARIAQEIKDTPGQRVLFDAARDLSPEDIKVVMAVIEGLKAKEKR
jgi:transcriptional regulator with XRE-family HTH domain